MSVMIVIITFSSIAVGDLGFPIASLTVDVESQTGGAADGGQADGTGGSGLVAADHVAAVAVDSQAKVFFRAAVFAQLFGRFGNFFIVLTFDASTVAQS